MKYTWDDFFAEGNKLAIHTGHRNRIAFLEEFECQAKKRKLNICFYREIGNGPAYRDTLAFDLYWHNHRALGYDSLDFFKKKKYTIVNFEDITGKDSCNFEDIDEVLFK